MKAFLIVSLAVLTYAVCMYLLEDRYEVSALNSQVLAILAILLVNHYLYTKNFSAITPLLSLDVLFLIGIVSMCFSVPIIKALGADEIELYATRGFSEYFADYLLISLFAVAAFSVGFILARGTKPAIANSVAGATSRNLTMYFVLPGTILLLYFAISGGQYYISGSYNEVYSLEERLEVPFFVSQILLTLGAISTVIRSKRILQYFSLTNLILQFPYHLLLFLLLVHGDRGTLIICMSPLLFLFVSRVPKRFGAITLVVAVVVVMIMIGVLRTARNQEERGISAIATAAQSADVTDNIKVAALNIGSSGLLLNVAMEYQDKNGKTMGRFTANSLLGAFPYSRRFLLNMGVLPNWEYREGADLLTEYLLGPNSTSGVGTSTLAELYLEFGWFGVLIGHLLIGWGAGYIQRHGENPKASEGRLIIYIFSIGLFAIMPRYSAVSIFIRWIGYAVVAVFFVQWIASRKSLRKAA